MMKEEETIETNQSRINALVKTFKYSHLRYIYHFFDA